MNKLCAKEHPVVVDGRNVVEPDVFIDAGFRGLTVEIRIDLI